MFSERAGLRATRETGHPWKRARKCHIVSGMLTERSADRLALRALKLSEGVELRFDKDFQSADRLALRALKLSSLKTLVENVEDEKKSADRLALRALKLL